ncbi:MAG: hypothetical protein HY720_30940 [Planctomycetes bacterium]|nr:hypothetical protein [Planctomycetota bacterium]
MSLAGRFLLLLAIWLPAGSARAQEDPWREPWAGVDAFCRLLALRGLAFDTSDSDWRDRDPATQVVVIFGDTAALESRDAFAGGALERFVKEGGSLLFASDRGDTGNVLAGFQVLFGPASVTVPESARAEHAYFGLEDCPLVRNVSSSNPIFRDAVPLATNRPGYIVSGARLRRDPRGRLYRTGEEIQPVLKRLAAFHETSGYQVVFPDVEIESRPIFMVGGSHGKGRAYVLADHSVFINRMMFEVDFRPTANARFAANLADELALGGKKHVLVLYDGVRISPQAPAIPALPRANPRLRPPRNLVETLNRFLSWLEDSRALSEFADQTSSVRQRTFQEMLAATVIVVTPLLFLGTLRSAARGRRRKGDGDPGPARGQDPACAVLQARASEVTRSGNFAEPMALAARRFLLAFPGLERACASPGIERARTAFRLPRGWSRRRLARDLARLAAWAGERPLGWDTLSFKRYRANLAFLKTIEAAIRGGRISLDG